MPRTCQVRSGYFCCGVDAGEMIEATARQRIHVALEAAFAPVHLDVRDDSADHAGHSGARPGGETHFSVTIVSRAFAGHGRVARHRMVNEALGGEFARGMHALAIRALAPGEAGA